MSLHLRTTESPFDEMDQSALIDRRGEISSGGDGRHADAVADLDAIGMPETAKILGREPDPTAYEFANQSLGDLAAGLEASERSELAEPEAPSCEPASTPHGLVPHEIDEQTLDRLLENCDLSSFSKRRLAGEKWTAENDTWAERRDELRAETNAWIAAMRRTTKARAVEEKSLESDRQYQAQKRDEVATAEGRTIRRRAYLGDMSLEEKLEYRRTSRRLNKRKQRSRSAAPTATIGSTPA